MAVPELWSHKHIEDSICRVSFQSSQRIRLSPVRVCPTYLAEMKQKRSSTIVTKGTKYHIVQQSISYRHLLHLNLFNPNLDHIAGMSVMESQSFGIGPDYDFKQIYPQIYSASDVNIMQENGEEKEAWSNLLYINNRRQ